MGMWYSRVPKNHHDLHPLLGWKDMHILVYAAAYLPSMRRYVNASLLTMVFVAHQEIVDCVVHTNDKAQLARTVSCMGFTISSTTYVSNNRNKMIVQLHM